MKSIMITITLQTDDPRAAARACRELAKLGFGAVQAEDDPGPQPEPPPTDPPNG